MFGRALANRRGGGRPVRSPQHGWRSIGHRFVGRVRKRYTRRMWMRAIFAAELSAALRY